jgi:glucuronate isomerase
MIGADIEAGLIPADRALVGEMIENICYKNAEKYFGLEAGKL